MRRWISLFAFVIATFLLAHTNAVSAAAVTYSLAPKEHASKLEKQVEAWAETLSAQPQFKSWKKATASIVPLGPGTHSWLVTFRLERQPVGYMIVHATAEGGYMLGEYGAGSHPAFDPNTLYSSMVRQGLFTSFAEAIKKPLHLERLYISPVLAVWKYKSAGGETYYLDAWTGEALPISDRLWNEQVSALAAAPISGLSNVSVVSKLSAAKANKAFDPYERLPWLTKSPLSKEQINRLPELLDHFNQIRFTAELFRDTVLFVFPAIGYHRWDEKSIFVAFDSLGARYIQMETLKQEGRFYN
ncbi:hypothetical protein [Paenibacillus montanisoli]|uniref:Uncharacterized protein n=1 Tax=Paenibacillus montanisoli TaxID=2081970 RepID=A0A328U632_9BACL|nr:hypothetical protein [Paenibacillus montanisoli]RAP78029.1 hypothetical protein DL346_06165 [Paenibacillus montanisoli]